MYLCGVCGVGVGWDGMLVRSGDLCGQDQVFVRTTARRNSDNRGYRERHNKSEIKDLTNLGAPTRAQLFENTNTRAPPRCISNFEDYVLTMFGLLFQNQKTMF